VVVDVELVDGSVDGRTDIKEARGGRRRDVSGSSSSSAEVVLVALGRGIGRLEIENGCHSVLPADFLLNEMKTNWPASHRSLSGTSITTRRHRSSRTSRRASYEPIGKCFSSDRRGSKPWPKREPRR
jgi:hypothetical protein